MEKLCGDKEPGIACWAKEWDLRCFRNEWRCPDVDSFAVVLERAGDVGHEESGEKERCWEINGADVRFDGGFAVEV